jgi:TLR4 regulator and MIR-interacting MSAP
VELQRKLDDEVLYKVIDMRHRLDKNGQRYGKVIDYRVSEQRAVNLLDGLCSAMDDYTIVKDDIIDRSSGASGAAVSGGGDGGGAAGDDDDGEAAAAAAAPSSPQLMWIKHRGPGATKLPSGSR